MKLFLVVQKKYDFYLIIYKNVSNHECLQKKKNTNNNKIK